MTRYLTTKEVILINALVIKRYTPKEDIKVINLPMLESAINRPRQSAFEKDAYPTLWLKGSALYFSLANNHAFANGNKRTALSSLIQFLYVNGIKFMASEENAENFTVLIVKKKTPPIRLEKIAEWIEKKSIPIES